MSAEDPGIDCRTEAGIVVGLIDGMIAQSRIVAKYLRANRSEPQSKEVRKALADVRTDEDVALVTAGGNDA